MIFKRVLIGVFIFFVSIIVLYAGYKFNLNRKLPLGDCISLHLGGSKRLMFDVSKAGTTFTCEVEVKEEDWYSVELAYLYDEKKTDDARRVLKIIDRIKKDENGKSSIVGPPVSIHVMLTKNTDGKIEKMIDQNVSEPKMTSSAAWGQISAELVRKVLQPGRYVITATSLKNVPEMKDVQTSLEFMPAYTGK